MSPHSIISGYQNYEPLREFYWKEEPMIRTSFVFLFFAILFTFYFNNLILIGVILYLIAIVLPIYPIFHYLSEKENHQERPDIAQIDDIFFDDLENSIRARSLSKLEIEFDSVDQDNVYIIPAPIYWKNETLSESSIYRVSGYDGIERYSAWEVMVLVLTEKYVSVYECTFDWLGGCQVSDERTSEFFYNDIIAIKTQTIERDRELIDGSKISRVQVLKLLTLSGDSIELEINRNMLSAHPDIGPMTDRAIGGIRKMLRDKKYQEVKMEVVRNVENPNPSSDEQNEQQSIPTPNEDDEFEGAI